MKNGVGCFNDDALDLRCKRLEGPLTENLVIKS